MSDGNTMRDALAEKPGQSTKTVLVVEDSKFQRRLVARFLKAWGFVVAEASNGEEALQLCRQQRPDFVVSDWLMPGMDGLEFCRAFREMPSDNYGYFILLTSKKDQKEVAEGFDAGADDFVSKPVEPHVLRARMTAGGGIWKMQRGVY
ncbi:MAG: PleD family two-component system response regulator, partial [Arenibacterium sp.]